MVKITLEDNLHIKINCEDRQYLEDLKEHFSFHVPGHNYMPRFLRTAWDGRLCLVKNVNILPFGLLLDVIKFHKKKYKTLPLKVDGKVKALFMGKKLKPIYNLKFLPRPYQKDCIETILNTKRSIVKVATASGKSLIISYIIKTLIENYKNKQYLIIVPTINLVEQFYSDLVDYGIDRGIIGRIYANVKEPDKPIIVSTWQSLQNDPNYMKRFFAIFSDECHISSRGVEIKNILKSAINGEYFCGVTVTLPSTQLELANIKSYLGPVIKDYSAKELAEDGYISKCSIIAYNIQHQHIYEGEYFEIREKMFSNPARMRFIRDTVKGIDGNILILVSLVENEGRMLESYLTEHMPDREVIFIHGNTKVKDREHHRLDFDDRNNKIVIATWGIYKMGVNIPSLKYIIFASPLKSKISVLQSVGRVLRMHADKTDGAYVIDLIDQVPYLYSHGEIRLEYYKKEGFLVTEKKVCLLPPSDMI